MRRTLVLSIVLLFFQGTEGSAQVSSGSAQRAVLNQYCVTCHSEKLHTAGLSLEQADVDHPADNAAVWEKVLHKVRTREMPPARVPRPDEVTYNSLAKYLETALDQAAETTPNPGRPAVYRLNRFQYSNGIRDL